MHYFWSYCHFIAAILDAMLIGIIISKDHRSALNLTCASVFGCLGLWSMELTWIHHPSTPLSQADFLERVGSIGWIWFTLFFLWFAWLYTRKPRIRFFKIYALAFITIPSILTYQQIANAALINEHILQSWGWLSVWSTSCWTYCYFAYYTIAVITGLYLIITFWKNNDNPTIRRQSMILIGTGFISLIVGSLVNVILPVVLSSPPTPIADITTLIWGTGLAYTALKYRTLDITPFMAAQQIVAAMNDLLFLLDTRGNIISVNGSAARALGCSERQLIGSPFGNLVAGEPAEHDSNMEKIRNSSTCMIETVITHGQGPLLPVALSTSLLPGTGIVCVAHDITLQKLRTETLHLAKKTLETEISKATDQLQKTNRLLTQEVAEKEQAVRSLMETEERFRVIFERAPDGIYLADPHGICIDANNETLRITGYDKTELTGLSVLAIGMSRSTALAASPDAASVDTARSESYEVTIRRKNGSLQPAEVTTHPIKIGSRELVLGVVRDLSQKKKAEAESRQLKEELQQAQKLEAIGRLAGGIAHDFNNMLGGIIGYAGLLHRQLHVQNPEAAAIVAKILAVARQASERIAQLLAFARKGKYRIEPVDMHAVIDEVIGLLEHTIDKKISLTRLFDAKYFTVTGDRSQLYSAILNVGVNARDALPNGGAITIATETGDIPSEQADSFPDAIAPGAFLKIMIRDNGIGMDEATRSRIFEPFFSTKEQGRGTGLGMASVYGTVKHHNGFIELKSAPGVGTTFVIGLPLSNDAAPTTPEPSPVVTEAARTGTILIVDDVQIVREMMGDALREHGYTTYEFEDGFKAIAWFRDHFNECDLVILDYTMPNISGRECFLAMKEICPTVKTIISSGHAMDNDIREVLEEGALTFVQKPFEIEDLAAAVEKALRGGGA